jgi:hypothetical protein
MVLVVIAVVLVATCLWQYCRAAAAADVPSPNSNTAVPLTYRLLQAPGILLNESISAVSVGLQCLDAIYSANQ